MNFLAHIYLSGKSNEVKLGNFVGDFVKGNKYMDYPDEIRKGIMLHRHIDSFTDSHAIVKSCSERWKPYYHRYSGVVVDFVFDHFLAKNWSVYSNVSLNDYVNDFFSFLSMSSSVMPPKARRVAHYMEKNNRLQSYATLEGIGKAMELTAQFTSFPQYTEDAIDVLTTNYDAIATDFEYFFADILKYVSEEYRITP